MELREGIAQNKRLYAAKLLVCKSQLRYHFKVQIRYMVFVLYAVYLSQLGSLVSYLEMFYICLKIDENMFVSEELFSQNRSSLDLVANNSGEKFVNRMDSTISFILNVRAPFDSPAQLTFMGYSKSVIDLVWTSVCGLQFIKALKVSPLSTLADHLSLILPLSKIPSKLVAAHNN